MKIPYKRISHEKRIIIEQLRKRNYSNAAIANEIGCHRCTITRELKRCNPVKYIALQSAWVVDKSGNLKKTYT